MLSNTYISSVGGYPKYENIFFIRNFQRI